MQAVLDLRQEQEQEQEREREWKWVVVGEGEEEDKDLSAEAEAEVLPYLDLALKSLRRLGSRGRSRSGVAIRRGRRGTPQSRKTAHSCFAILLGGWRGVLS